MGYFKHHFCEFSYGSNASRDVLRSKNVWLRLRRASGGWGARPPNPLSPSVKAPTRPQKPHPRAASDANVRKLENSQVASKDLLLICCYCLKLRGQITQLLPLQLSEGHLFSLGPIHYVHYPVPVYRVSAECRYRTD